jgi:hypothetical protein
VKFTVYLPASSELGVSLNAVTRNLTDYRVFIASPGGLESERQAFKDILFEQNINEANGRNTHFTPEGWEITISGVGRPQSLINKQIEECDYFILLLHDRWGSSPTEVATLNRTHNIK